MAQRARLLVIGDGPDHDGNADSLRVEADVVQVTDSQGFRRSVK